jgi:ankyrin repeat protein
MATPNAASEAYKRGYEDIAADLFSYGGIPDANACLARGNYAAVLQGFLYDPEVASKQLLTLGNPDLVRTCLQHEPKFTPSEQFKILFDYMRLNSSDIQRARERAQIMNMLLDYGFDPNLRDQENMSLLHRAVGCMWRGRWMNSQDVMIVFTDILLDHGADINAKDDDLKSTPLAWHARYGHEQVVGFLLSRGAATNLADDEPWATPLAWAQKKGHEGITALFQ